MKTWPTLSTAALMLGAVSLFTQTAPSQYRPSPPRVRPPVARPPVARPPMARPPAARPPVARAPGAKVPTARPMRPRTPRAVTNRQPPRLTPLDIARLQQAQRDLSQRRTRRGGGGGGGARTTAAVSLTLDSIATDPKAKLRASAEANKFFGSEFQGKDVRKGVQSVRRLTWHKTLGRAAAAARRQGKPILWIQALGELGGYT